MNVKRRCSTCLHDKIDPQNPPCLACFYEDMAKQGYDRDSQSFPGMKHYPHWEPADGFIDSVQLRKIPGGDIVFHVTDVTAATPPILELRANGDIFSKGKLIDNDKQIVDAMREFLDAMRKRTENKPKCNCCSRGDEYNGFHTGPHLFECPKHCACHD
jgi:hypothetical protein